jgi:hypothetical protein
MNVEETRTVAADVWGLDAERSNRATPRTDLIGISADLELLADVLHGGLDGAGGRLDLSSGEVWPEAVLTEAWPDDADELDDEERWLYVEPIGSRPAYLDMIDFIVTRTDSDLSARLEGAVDGRGAFGPVQTRAG